MSGSHHLQSTRRQEEAKRNEEKRVKYLCMTVEKDKDPTSNAAIALKQRAKSRGLHSDDLSQIVAFMSNPKDFMEKNPQLFAGHVVAAKQQTHKTTKPKAGMGMG